MATNAQNHSDEYIEKWGDVYERERIIDYGISFEIFLQYPDAVMDSIKRVDFLPLLPAQIKVAAQVRHRAAMEQLEQEYEEQLTNKNAVMRDSGLIERMGHCRHHRRQPIKHVPWTLRGTSHV